MVKIMIICNESKKDCYEIRDIVNNKKYNIEVEKEEEVVKKIELSGDRSLSITPDEYFAIKQVIEQNYKDLFDKKMKGSDVDVKELNLGETIRWIIKILKETYTDAVPKDKIVEKLEYLDYNKDEIEEELDRLRDNGKIYTPTQGHYDLA